MGIEALLHDDDGQLLDPSAGDDWRDWVSATATRNHALRDPLLDWMDLYGSIKGYTPDDQLPGHDPRTDSRAFVFSQGRRFEQAVMEHLRTHVDILTIDAGTEGTRDLAAAERTVRAMIEGAPAIAQGALRNPQDRTYGSPDLIIRSDVLHRLFPDALDEAEAMHEAPGIEAANWHYRIVDIKFTTLHLSAGGTLRNEGSSPAYKLQLHTYNRALGRVQGCEPDRAYLIGRGWEQKRGKESLRGFSCMDRLAAVLTGDTAPEGQSLRMEAEAGAAWVRDVRRDGMNWVITPTPSRRELYPNLGHAQDWPWHHAKQDIADVLEELTLLPQVGISTRETAHKAGILRWRDANCTPEALGFSSGVKHARK